jgi:ATP phosphoribosyltransferase regulatory subunit
MAAAMTQPTSSPLLPEGLRDRLPSEAEAASRVTRALIDAMRGHGYARVAPPLAEFRETLGGDAGEASGQNLLRFTDPVSRRTLAIRPDITRQVGRIATSRLAAAPRPLRLSYSGQVVKLRANDLWPEREMLQAGAELIGSDSAAAAAEIVGVAVTALAAAGVAGITVDFTLPDCVDLLLGNERGRQADAIKAALDGKDAGALTALGAADLAPLLAATGPFDTALARLRAFDARGVLAHHLTALEAIAAPLAGRATLTLDPTERHGFAYQSWFGFSLFVAGHRVTIGRGGSYDIVHPNGRHEPAMGFSLYPDPLIEAGLGDGEETQRRLFLPLSHDPAVATQLRGEGWATVAALAPGDDGRALGCTHRLAGAIALPY